MKKPFRILSFILAASLAGALAGCGETDEAVIRELSESDLDVPAKVTAVRGTIAASQYADAWVEPYIVQLSFDSEGAFDEFTVQLGSEVKKGDVLATINTENLRENIKNTESNIESLNTEHEHQLKNLQYDLEIIDIRLKDVLKRVEDMTEAGEANSDKFYAACVEAGNYDSEKRRIELKIKQLNETYDLKLPEENRKLSKLRSELAKSTIKAPFDGVIVAVANVRRGEYISSDKYYVAIADPGIMVARALSPGNNAPVLSVRTELIINGNTYDTEYIPRDSKYNRLMKNSAEPKYDEFFITDPEGTLSFADNGKLRYVSKEKEDVVILPLNTVRTAGRVSYVYKDVDGKYEKCEVTLGIRSETEVEIVSGITEGEVVYVQE